MSAYKKLLEVQKELVVNKARETSRYKYRNAEDILEAVKPLLSKKQCCIVLNDDVEVKEGRFYVKATATFVDTETDEKVSVSSYAREDAESKLMQTAQLTGSSISYARKYALGGLLCIDDGNDADKQVEIDERMKFEEEKKIKERGDKIRQVANEMKRTGIEEKEILQHFGIESIRRSNNETLDEIIFWLASIKV